LGYISESNMRIQILSDGDKGQAICESCARVVASTYRYRNVPFSDGKGIASNILVGVCDQCETVVAIPAQSTPAIKRDRRVASQSIEAALPAPYVDALDLACFTIDPNSTAEFRKKLLLFYVHKLASGELDMAVLRAREPSFAVKTGTVKRRLSMKVSAYLADEFSRLVSDASMSRTDLLKSLVVEIKRQIVDGEDVSMLGELRTLACLG
jgi:hypothetical protein